MEYTYTYGINGNITSAVEDGVTNTYTYGDSTWKDLLTAYNGQTITYDAIGNPLTYRDGMTFTWQNGRQLAGVTKNGVTTSYVYNADGGQYTKTVDGVLTQYYCIDGVLYAESTGSNTLLYLYDDKGVPYAIRHNGTIYYYEYNVQGDVIGLFNSAGTRVASYTYDPWGKLLSLTDSTTTGIGTLNPLRYRGYYYDNETGFYYVSSRYYDPEIGRWINADNQLSTGSDLTGRNLFAYCGNNPVNRIDPTGKVWWHWALGAVVVAACAVATVVTAAIMRCCLN